MNTTATQHPAEPLSSEKQQTTILIIDDDPNLRMLLSSALAEDNYATVTAQDGMEGLAQCQNTRPDIILLDAIMPQMDGINCCREIQQQYEQQAPSIICPPIIMITALSDNSAIDAAFAAGASDFITKPIHWPILQHRLKLCIEKTQLQHELLDAHNEIKQLQTQLDITPVS